MSSDLIGTPTSPVGISYPYPQTSTLYSFFNVTVGASGSTGSGNLNVSNYKTKSIYAFIHTTQNASGSLIISGSFNRTNFFEMESGSFNSGSLSWYTITDVVPIIQCSVRNYVTGSAVSGSLFVVAQ